MLSFWEHIELSGSDLEFSGLFSLKKIRLRDLDSVNQEILLILVQCDFILFFQITKTNHLKMSTYVTSQEKKSKRSNYKPTCLGLNE